MTTTTKETIGSRVNDYADHVAIIRDLESQIKRHKDELTKEEERLLADFAKDGIQNMKTAAGQTVYLNREVFARLVGDTKKAYRAMRRAGLWDFIKPTVSAQTLKAYVREMEKSGEEIPKGLLPYIDITEVYRLRMRS